MWKRAGGCGCLRRVCGGGGEKEGLILGRGWALGRGGDGAFEGGDDAEEERVSVAEVSGKDGDNVLCAGKGDGRGGCEEGADGGDGDGDGEERLEVVFALVVDEEMDDAGKVGDGDDADELFKVRVVSGRKDGGTALDKGVEGAGEVCVVLDVEGLVDGPVDEREDVLEEVLEGV